MKENLDFYYFYLNYRLRNHQESISISKNIRKQTVISNFVDSIIGSIEGDFDRYSSYAEKMIEELLIYDRKDIEEIPDDILLILGMAKDTNILGYNSRIYSNSNRSAYDCYFQLAYSAKTSISSFGAYELVSEVKFAQHSEEFNKLLLLKNIKKARDNGLLYGLLTKFYNNQYENENNLSILFLASHYSDINAMNTVCRLFKNKYPSISIVIAVLMMLKIRKMTHAHPSDSNAYQNALQIFYDLCEDSRVNDKDKIKVFSFLVQNNNSAGYYGYYELRKNSRQYSYLSRLLLEKFIEMEDPQRINEYLMKEYAKFKNAQLDKMNLQAFDNLNNTPIVLYDLLNTEYLSVLRYSESKIDNLIRMNSI